MRMKGRARASESDRVNMDVVLSLWVFVRKASLIELRVAELFEMSR